MPPGPRGTHRGMRATGIPGASGRPEPRNQAASAQPGGLFWARQDSNLGPTDYESAALTAELRARDLRRAVAVVSRLCRWAEPDSPERSPSRGRYARTGA